MTAVNLYRLRLQPTSATLSPWQADTLFGHLCWAVYYESGRAGLAEFLAPFRVGHPPFVLSDGFPGDLFPRPLLPRRAPGGTSKPQRVQTMRNGKQEKSLAWLTQSQLEQALRGESIDLQSASGLEEKEETRVSLKNQINRLTGTTTGGDDAQTGNLYSVEERAYLRGGNTPRVGAFITFYLWAEDASQAERARQWVEKVSRSGYGKKKSVGYGQFRVHAFDTILVNAPDDADGVVSLANFVPAQTDPADGYYRTKVKYGKLGEGGLLDSGLVTPFKFPLVMLTAGSTFRGDATRRFVGRLVVPIHPYDQTLAHGAFAPVLPIKLSATSV